ncbi:TetR/AcrR family transcriptional regulator [Pantoea sp. NPDC088449]|uniref:Transcriptional regulator, TetR family n=1 Tax=Candidatus Pantoea floridensis TaxID=1938870 RepID=A0A286DM74_9GAMM|nr:TetR/AcrR family transcriptional regulator [Pantoea floridensis]PIF14702.1 TetR family transcriptional regulator [Enterobacteriaceae bacterium JKS000233]SOD59746.1 transcriptional regulator, TetR family [Pantoea floridensis]
MARPLDEEKRRAILMAALRIIPEEGLGATTALIAREAGISSGSLFTYFPDKVTLLNQLYLAIKTDVAEALMRGFPLQSAIRERAYHVWMAYIEWACAHPEQRATLQQLSVSRVVTAEVRAQSAVMFEAINIMLAELGTTGICDNVEFITSVMASLAESTIDFVLQSPNDKKALTEAGFNMFARATGI